MNEEDEEEIVIVDIDGTITDASARAEKYLSQPQKDWEGFYKACGTDKPITPILNLVMALSISYQIVYCTGRRASCENATRQWLKDNHVFLSGTNEYYGTFLFRRNGDKRHDTIVKPELLNEYLAKHPDKKVAFILEDRNSMVAKWRELGYTCLQVAEGDF